MKLINLSILFNLKFSVANYTSYNLPLTRVNRLKISKSVSKLATLFQNASAKQISLQVRDDDVVLEIECGTNTALMYLSRLCQGSKGPCIWFQDAWITPNEFQYISGRETAKDWKRSIRHCGKSMKLLLTKGILTTHPPICDCDGCRISSPIPQVQQHSQASLVSSTSTTTTQVGGFNFEFLLSMLLDDNWDGGIALVLYAFLSWNYKLRSRGM